MSTVEKIQELKKSRAALESSGKAARERISMVLDPLSFVEIGAFVNHRSTDFNMVSQDMPADGVVTGYGTIQGRLVYVYSQDASVMGGAVGEMHARKIAKLYEKALEMGAPVIGILDSAGLRLQELTDALEGYGAIYQVKAKASGVIPQITVVAGMCAGGETLLPGMSDFTFMLEKQSKVFVSSPNAMEKGTKEEDIAGAKVHGAKSGMADFVCEDEADCFAKVRTLVDLLPANNAEDAPVYEDMDDLNRVSEVLDSIVPEDGEGFDVRGVIGELADNAIFVETKADFAPGMVTGFVRLNGGTVGVVANNSAVEDGILTIAGCRKAAGFVAFCDAFSIPILTLTDTAGFAAGVQEENGGLADAVSKMTFAFASATAPKINVILRKAYGSAYVTMNSKHIGADVVYAWPTADISVMNSVSAARIMFAKDVEAGADLSEKAADFEVLSSPYAAASRGYIDDIIEPALTRKHLLVALGMLISKRQEGPAKKHGTIL